ncbi:hypothetical protein [Aeropyrum camini]|nr:hypothetical protein [Aeropyrum camini]
MSEGVKDPWSIRSGWVNGIYGVDLMTLDEEIRKAERRRRRGRTLTGERISEIALKLIGRDVYSGERVPPKFIITTCYNMWRNES